MSSPTILNYGAQELRQILAQARQSFGGLKVGILGDICVDRYIYGSVHRINPEAPVPIVEYERELFKLGMSGNVAAGVAETGAQVELFSVCGEDDHARHLKDLIDQAPRIKAKLISEKNRPTTTKIRILAGNQHVVRIDRETLDPIQKDSEDQLLDAVAKAAPTLHVLVVQEHAKGLFSERLAKELFALSKKHKLAVCIDPNRNTPFSRYQGCELMTPNTAELLHFCGVEYKSRYDLVELAQSLRRKIELPSLIVTLGKDGMLVLDRDREPLILPTFAREVFEVSGAGDTVMAFLALGRGANLPLAESALLANLAASVVCGKFGTSTASLDEIEKQILRVC